MFHFYDQKNMVFRRALEFLNCIEFINPGAKRRKIFRFIHNNCTQKRIFYVLMYAKPNFWVRFEIRTRENTKKYIYILMYIIVY